MTDKTKSSHQRFHLILSSLLVDITKSQRTELIVRILSEFQILGLILLSALEYSKHQSQEFSTVVINCFIDLAFLNQTYESYNPRLTLLFIAAYIIVLSILAKVAFIGKMDSFDRNLGLKRLMNSLILLHTGVISLYLNLFLFKIIEIHVGSGGQIDLAIGAGILLILSNIYGILGARFSYCRLNGNYELGMRNSFHAIAGYLYKLIVVLFRTWVHQMYGIFVLGLSLIYILIVIREFSFVFYFHLRTFEVFAVSLVIQAAWVIGQILGLVIWDGDINSIFYIFILLMVILLKLTSHLEQRISIIGLTPTEKIDNERTFYLKLLSLKNTLSKGQNFSLTENYKLQELIFVNLDKKIKLQSSPLDLLQHSNKVLDKYLEFGTTRFKDDDIKLIKIYFRLMTAKNPSYTTMIELLNLKRPRTKLDIRILATYLIAVYDRQISRKTHDEEGISIRQVFKYYRAKLVFLEEIKKSAEDYLRFWKSEKAENKISDLLRKSIKMSSESKVILKIWTEINKVDSRTIQLEALNYAFYLNLIRNAPYSSFKIIKEKVFFHHNRDLSGLSSLMKSLEDDNAMTLIIEIQADGMEKIIYSTRNIEFLGYDSQNLLGQSIEFLFPGVYRSGPKFNLLSYVESVKESASGTFFKMFIRSSTSSVSIMDCYVCPIATEARLMYIFVIVPLEGPNEDYLLFENLNIEGWSENIFKDLDLKRLLDSSKSFNVQEMLLLTKARHWGEARTTPKLEDAEPVRSKEKEHTIVRYMKRVATLKMQKPEKKVPLIPEVTKTANIAFNNGRSFIRYEVTHLGCSNPHGMILKFIKMPSEESLNSFELGELFENVEERKENDVKNMRYRTTLEIKNSVDQRVYLEPLSLQKQPKIAGEKKKGETITTLSNVRTAIDQKAENSIYTPKKRQLDNIPNYTMVIYIILAILLLLLFLLISFDNLDKLPKIYDTASILFERHNSLWQWVFYNSALIKMMLMGIVDERAGVTGQENYYSSLQSLLREAKKILQFDYKIQQVLPLFDNDLQEKFFTKIKVWTLYNQSQYEMINMFELDNRIAMAANVLMNYQYTNYTDLGSNVPQIEFIIGNTMDDLYILEESFNEVIRENINRQLDYLKTFSLTISLILTFLGAIIFGAIFKVESIFIRKKQIFSEAMNRVTVFELDRHLEKVENFIEYQNDANKLIYFHSTMLKGSHGKSKFGLKKESSKKNEIKKFSSRDLNAMNFFLIFSILLVQIVIIGVSFGIQILLDNSSSKIMNHMDDAIQASVIFNDLCAISVPLYLYIESDGKTTMKNRPYSSVFEEQMDDLSYIQTFYRSLLDRLDSDLSADLYLRYTTDLCNFVDASDCLQVLEPIVREGALPLFAFVIKAARAIKFDFDTSNKTLQEKRNILYSDNYINIEWASYYLPNTTQTIQNALQTQVNRNISTYKSNILVTFIIYTIGSILFYIVFWRPIWRELKRQRIVIYEMLKLIPMDVLHGNVYMKNFWSRFTSMDKATLNARG